LLEGLVHHLLEFDDAAPAVAAIGGDDRFGAGIVNPARQRLGAEAAEYHRVSGADPGASQHGDRELGDHGHVDGYSIARLDSFGLQHIGEPAHFAVQILIREDACIPWFPLPDDRCLVLPPAAKVAVNAVVRDVELATHEPFGEGRAPIEDARMLLEPLDLCGHSAPELVRIVGGLAGEPLILVDAPDVGPGAELGRGGKDSLLFQDGGDAGLGHASPPKWTG
jgi:hypothetical protein